MTYAQPTVKAEDIRLPGLDGMLPGGNVKGREKTVLEKLIEAEKLAVQFCLDTYSIEEDKIHEMLLEKLKTELLTDFDFKIRDLMSYVRFISTQESYYPKFLLPDKKQLARGYYSGCLLEILTLKRKEQGLGTKLHFDGDGGTFDYLFSRARYVDEVVIDNLKGDGICEFIASNGGEANLIMLLNCKGIDLGNTIGYNKGKIKLFVAVGNDGNETAAGAGMDANVDTIIVADNKNGSVGTGISSGSGHTECLVIYAPQKKGSSYHSVRQSGNVNLEISCNEYTHKARNYEQGEDWMPDRIKQREEIKKIVALSRTITGRDYKEILSIVEKIKQQYELLKPDLRGSPFK